MTGKDLTLDVKHGFSFASLPQLSQITIAEPTGLYLEGVDVADLAIVKTGLGEVTASGKVTNLEVNANGLCSVDLSELVAENVTVNITSDDTRVVVHAAGKLIVNIDGNGSSVRYTGGAELTENITGASSVIGLADLTSGSQFSEAPQSPAPNTIGD